MLRGHFFEQLVLCKPNPRRDPVLGLICGKRDPLGQDRVLERDKCKALAAHSTLNRLELSAQGIDLRYHKIEAQPEETEALLIKRGVKAIPRKRRGDRAGF